MWLPDTKESSGCRSYGETIHTVDCVQDPIIKFRTYSEVRRNLVVCSGSKITWQSVPSGAKTFTLDFSNDGSPFEGGETTIASTNGTASSLTPVFLRDGFAIDSFKYKIVDNSDPTAIAQNVHIIVLGQ